MLTLVGAGHRLPVVVVPIGGWGMLSWCGLRDVAAVDIEGAWVAVDAGDVAMWLSCLFVGRLLWFVGGRRCSWWWGLLVGNMVAGRT